MPELPEVETIRQGAQEKLVDKKIIGIEVRVPKMFIGAIDNAVGAKIKNVRRIAKILIIDLNNGYSILIHLKLTGQLVYVPKDKKVIARGGHFQSAYNQPMPHAHTHIIYEFSDGSHLYFNDLRKFGWHKIVKSGEVEKLMGNIPEPKTKEFSIKYLKEIFSKTSKPVKIVLMDQQKIGGIGNIYANDALYWAGILPSRPAKSLSESEILKLKKAIEKVIDLGLKYGGSSENTYVNIEGRRGQYMEHAAVYQQKKDPKGHEIKKIQLGGRGTFFCPICQH
jgi:formamidopyrimidine-DNA glycosylase